MPAYDFSASFIRWTSTRIHHTPRMQVDAAVRVATGGSSVDYFLSAPCAGETMYAPRDLIQRPAYDFVMIAGSDGRFRFAKLFGDASRNACETHRVGGSMSTHDGRGAPLVELVAHAAPLEVEELRGFEAVRAALLGNARIVGTTDLSSADGSVSYELSYPVKTCNISHEGPWWQVDAGPVLLPDPGADAAGALEAMRPGYLVFNDQSWAEAARLRVLASDEAEAGSRFGPPRRLAVRNRLFAAIG